MGKGGRTDMTKLRVTVGFRNFAKGPKTKTHDNNSGTGLTNICVMLRIGC
jgi:hypothetical protein